MEATNILTRGPLASMLLVNDCQGYPSLLRVNRPRFFHPLDKASRTQAIARIQASNHSSRFGLAQNRSQRLDRVLRHLYSPLQIVIDQPHQRAEFCSARIDIFRVMHTLRNNEFLKARVGALHHAKTVDIITSLQRQRLSTESCRRSGTRGNMSHEWPPRVSVLHKPTPSTPIKGGSSTGWRTEKPLA